MNRTHNTATCGLKIISYPETVKWIPERFDFKVTHRIYTTNWIVIWGNSSWILAFNLLYYRFLSLFYLFQAKNTPKTKWPSYECYLKHKMKHFQTKSLLSIPENSLLNAKHNINCATFKIIIYIRMNCNDVSLLHVQYFIKQKCENECILMNISKYF